MRKSSEIIVNLIFWSVIFYYIYKIFCGIILSSSLSPINPESNMFLEQLISSVAGMVINFYVFYFYLIPKLLFRKRFILCLLFSIFSTILSTIVSLSLKAVFFNGQSPIHIYEELIFFFMSALIIGIVGGAIKGFFLWWDSAAERRQLEKKHIESKTALLLLKAQLNPHFLFNSLNNIDILIEENPKTGSEYLKKLSDILRYVLYETKEDKTDLEKEIFQIKNYIELQKIRTNNPRYVNFKVTGELKGQKIAPMIYLPFIENAFKHSKNKTIDNAIEIEFEVYDDLVKMICKNYYDATQLEVIKTEGLGIETIKQRLNLLYPEHHQLIIDKTEHWFNVTLSIKMKDGN